MAPAKKKPDASELMIVNDALDEECRIAIIQDNHLEELYTERTATATNVGNIYKGRVTNVEPAIQAAFIDFGEGQNGFLHISDLHPRYFPGQERKEQVGKKIPRRDRPLMQEALKRGDEVIVQVLKEGLGTKGPTLTSYLSIPGRLLVAMPGMDRVGVSRKVEDDEKRRNMRQVLDSLDLPEGFGFILRTAGFDRTKTELKRDVAYLMRLWKLMEQRRKSAKGPCELYTESDLLIRTIRDVYRPTVKAIVVDTESAWHRATNFLRVAAPRSAPKVIRYYKPTPIFHAFDIERQIELIHSREVPLPAGGKLVIEQTEALVAIDVNSGKSRAAKDSETNAYRTNCEAVDEICRQLRLRDLGGLIIHDLIDMRSRKHRKQIEERFAENLKLDRAKATVLRISEFGLVEMTRQRMRPSLRKSHFVTCPHCHGLGELKSPETVGSDATRQVGYLLQFDRVRRVEVVCSPKVASVLLSSKRRELVRMEDGWRKRIDVRVSDAIASDRVDFYAYDDRNADVDIEHLTPPQSPSLNELERESAAHEKKQKREDVERREPKAAELEEAAAAATEDGQEDRKKRRRRRRKSAQKEAKPAAAGAAARSEEAAAPSEPASDDGSKEKKSRRRKRSGEALRVHTLAREIGVPSRDVIERCAEVPEITVKNHMSTVSSDDAQTIREWFDADGAGGASDGRDDADSTDGAAPSRAPRKKRRRGGKKHAARAARAKAKAQAAAKADDETATDGGAESELATGPASEEDQGTSRKTGRGRRKRKKTTRGKSPQVNGQQMHESSDKPGLESTTSEHAETQQADSPGGGEEQAKSPKPKRRLYRNRSRVSTVAREQAERTSDS